MHRQSFQHFGGVEPPSYLSGEDLRPSSPSHHRNPAANNVDRTLYDDLVQIFPLVQSLIVCYVYAYFEFSILYFDMKKPGENGGNDQVGGDDVFPSRANLTKEREELVELREKVEDLQKQLLEKDEILKSAEASKSETDSVHSMLDQVKKQALEKDALLRSTQALLVDVKIKLADKQASVEKLQWEAMTSNKKVEKLQEDLNAIQGETSSYTLLFEGLSNDNYTLSHQECYDVTPHDGHLPEIDDMDEMEMRKMEEAQEAYMAAVAAAKEKQDDESIAKAANARLHLQSFVLKS
ncbi:putative microtubule binding protein 2C [Helianthus debilis subsp. tardiflorus]